MEILKSICIAISTYSILPVPSFEWTENTLRFSLCGLPLVGLFLGAFLLIWYWLCMWLGIGLLLFSVVAVLLPVLVTGGIHMDGFCDTADAIASRQEKKRKLEILKDPHVGAFAVLYVCVYLLLCLGCYSELFFTASPLPAVCVGFILSRSLAVWSVATMGNARKSGMLAAFQNHLEYRAALIVAIFCTLLCICGMLMLHVETGVFAILLCAVWFLIYRRMVIWHFGGITGDTTGFFLQMTELFILTSAVLGKIAERMV